MLPKGPITPNRHRKIKQRVNQTRRAYVQARRAMLATRLESFEREDAIYEALEARQWYYVALDLLHSAESRGVVKGAAWCPAAVERARRSGRMAD